MDRERMSKASYPSETGPTPVEKQLQRETGLEGGADEGAWQRDVEKQPEDHEDEVERMPTRRSAIQAIPGVRLDDDDDDDFEEGYESREGSGVEDREDEGREGGGRGGLGGVLDRVVSRVSTKSSWNPGPPPDGGVKAWTAGISP